TCKLDQLCSPVELHKQFITRRTSFPRELAPIPSRSASPPLPRELISAFWSTAESTSTTHLMRLPAPVARAPALRSFSPPRMRTTSSSAQLSYRLSPSDQGQDLRAAYSLRQTVTSSRTRRCQLP